ncbi:MAG: patatin-like phospholipase family protein [Erysipelotrichaceae bacterium]
MKTGLVFGGGGAKGAYEIGVWKAIRELDIHVDIVTGTSIGSLIGAMFVQDEFDKAYELWKNVSAGDVIKEGLSLDYDIDLIMSQKGHYKQLFSTILNNRGVADISPFITMIDQMFNPEKFFASDIDYACMTTKIPSLAGAPFIKGSMEKDKAKDYLLASASCFPAFPIKEIDGEKYVDGGYYDNVPIELARSMGAEFVIAVDLKAPGKRREKEPQTNLIYIKPYVPLGSFLNFEHEVLVRNIDLGYLDTLKKFDKLYGYVYAFDKSSFYDLSLFEENFNKFLKVRNKKVSKKLSDRIYEDMFEHNMTHYHNYQFKHLRLLELAAYLYELDLTKVYTFEPFIDSLLKAFKDYTYVEYVPIEKSKLPLLKDVAIDIKKFSRRDIIHFLYQRIEKEFEEGKDVLEYLSLLFPSEYTLALVFFMLEEIYSKD